MNHKRKKNSPKKSRPEAKGNIILVFLSLLKLNHLGFSKDIALFNPDSFYNYPSWPPGNFNIYESNL